MRLHYHDNKGWKILRDINGAGNPIYPIIRVFRIVSGPSVSDINIDLPVKVTGSACSPYLKDGKKENGWSFGMTVSSLRRRHANGQAEELVGPEREFYVRDFVEFVSKAAKGNTASTFSINTWIRIAKNLGLPSVQKTVPT